MDRHLIEQRVRLEVAKVLDVVPEIGGAEPLTLQGLDSLRSVELTLSLEDNFAIVFDDEDISFENFTSIDSIVELLDAKLDHRV